jgi:glycosyltransferase involved in cell wall biosynthesis
MAIDKDDSIRNLRGLNSVCHDDLSSLVSVIIPAKNVASYIRDAVASVTINKYRNCQVIVVDDHSDDETFGTACGIQDNRVKVVACRGRGIASAFNTGLKVANGKYVVRCDADDLVTGDRLAQQVAWMDTATDVVALAGGLDLILEDGTQVVPPRFYANKEVDITDTLNQGQVGVRMPTVIFRRDVLEKVGGCRPFFETGEDDDLMIRVAEHGQVWFSPMHVYRARLREGSITRSQSLGRLRWYLSCAEKFRQQRQSEGVDDLDRGQPPTPPDEFEEERVRPPRVFAQELMISESWRSLSDTKKKAAYRWALRALQVYPKSVSAYRHLAKLTAVLIKHRIQKVAHYLSITAS